MCKMVNRQTSYVNINIEAHTLTDYNIIEIIDAEIKLLKKMGGVPLNHLKSNFDHYY